MVDDERDAFLDDFRKYLVATGNRIVVERYDEGGITPGPVEGMFSMFVQEQFGEETK